MKPQVGINDSHEEMNPEMSPEIGRRKKYNYANNLVKIQACASFHMPADQLADTRREVLPKLIELCVEKLSWYLSKENQYSRGKGGVLNKDLYGKVIMASNQRSTTWRGGVEYQLLCEFALLSFYLQFLPAECPKIDVDSILNKVLAA